MDCMWNHCQCRWVTISHLIVCLYTLVHIYNNVIHISTAVFKMQNSTGGVNSKCIEAYSPTNEAWKCLSIQYAEPFTSSRLFALNSIYDSWQLANILQLPCHPPDCDARYMEALEEYGKVKIYTSAVIINDDIIIYTVIISCTYGYPESITWIM